MNSILVSAILEKLHFQDFVFDHSTLFREEGLYLWAVLAIALRFSEEIFVGIAHSGLMRRIPAFIHLMTSWDTETGFPCASVIGLLIAPVSSRSEPAICTASLIGFLESI